MSDVSLALDTTAAIAWIRGEPAIIDTLAETSVGLPLVTFGELLFGAESSSQRERNLARVYDLAALCEVLPVTESVAERYASLRKLLASGGNLIPSNDLWIAATAMDRGMILLGRDKHFASVPQLNYRQF
jgi:predicted nucleic acid-binding protein